MSDLDILLLPFQITWDRSQERHRAALEEFYETFPGAAEATYVTAETFDALLV